MQNELSARSAYWAFIATNYILAFAAASWADLNVDFVGIGAFLLPFGLCFASLYGLTWLRSLPKVSVLSDIAFGSTAITLSTLVSTYAAAKVGMPLADDTLASLDAALGIDWTSTIRVVDRTPWLSKVLEWSYQSFALQLLAIPMVLAVLGHSRRAYVFVAAFALIGMASSFVSLWFPALGTYKYYGIDPVSLTSINPFFGYHFLADFNAVRNDPTFVMTLAGAAGIVTFPSVHAAAAALCIWGGWQIPFARWLLIPLNAAMTLSAFTHANHYAADILAGLGIAAACVLGINAAVDWFGFSRFGRLARSTI
jgi:hypothetical protein